MDKNFLRVAENDMSKFGALIKKPVFMFAFILPAALISEFAFLEGFLGVSLPSDRGSAISSYAIQQKGKELHFITRNKRFSIVDLWTKQGSVLGTLVLRESFVADRQDGIEGEKATITVEALDDQRVRWSFEESGELGQTLNQVYEITKFGCCAAPNTYTYFSLRDGKRLRTTHIELSGDDLAALEKSLYD